MQLYMKHDFHTCTNSEFLSWTYNVIYPIQNNGNSNKWETVDREIESQIEINVNIDTTTITHTYILVCVCVCGGGVFAVCSVSSHAWPCNPLDCSMLGSYGIFQARIVVRVGNTGMELENKIF